MENPNQQSPLPAQAGRPPRVLIIGAGGRGNAYARAIGDSTSGVVAAIAEPIRARRLQFGRRYIWGADDPVEGQAFDSWTDYLRWELSRRDDANRGDTVPEGLDGVLICTLDETHAEIITSLAPLGLHVLSEKPLATTLDDCLKIYRSIIPPEGKGAPSTIFAIGHVLRYSPHNMLLRKLLLEDRVIGDVISMEHTEPVGWWHFAHSYVRGNWRKESTSAPSLLTKSCHDIDLLLWLLASPAPGSRAPPHLPSSITSAGSLVYFKPSNKPASAGAATNCLSCPAEPECLYSAKKIYHKALMSGVRGFPVRVVVPEIEDLVADVGLPAVETILLDRLSEDYTAATPSANARAWYGRCVYEAGNDVCDDQFVTLRWEDDSQETGAEGHSVDGPAHGRGPKTASFHMAASTAAVCERRSRIYGTRGEIATDSHAITVHDHFSGTSTRHRPPVPSRGGHGGGDDGLARQFLRGIDAVKNKGVSAADAQAAFIGCGLADIVRSHALVFAAEDARRGNRVVDWGTWWEEQVEGRLRGLGGG